MASTGETWRLGRRPALDGLRGVAVLMVTAHHSGITNLAFGSIGVGLFFALSGYLITGLIADELDRTGRIDLRGFYVRRFARLAPALLVMVLACDVLFTSMGQWGSVVASIPALTYWMNYASILGGHHQPSFGHTWSLAVEEHFYVVWPLLLPLLWRRGLRFALGATLGICALDVAYRWMVLEATGDSLRLYVGTPERVDALLYGCAAAIAVRLGWRPHRWLMIAAPAFMWWWMLAVESAIWLSGVMGICCALWVASIDAQPGLAERVLSTRPLVAIGLRSYAIYLWHIPLIATCMYTGMGRNGANVLSVPLAFAAAWASFRWVETPARSRIRGRFSSRQSENTQESVAVFVSTPR